jgi:hypothetical protein
MARDSTGSEPSQPPLAASAAALVSVPDRIGGLVTQRTWQRWTLSSFLARLPISMSLLGLVLAGQAATGSLATGTRLAGFTTLCAGLIGPLRGRLLDRGELRAGLQRSCLVHCGLLTPFAVCVHFKADVLVLYAPCAAIAYSVSGIWGGFRALLVAAVSPERLRRAHFVESLMVEVSYGAGPLLVTGLAVVGGAVTVLAGMGQSPCSPDSASSAWSGFTRARWSAPIFCVAARTSGSSSPWPSPLGWGSGHLSRTSRSGCRSTACRQMWEAYSFCCSPSAA